VVEDEYLTAQELARDLERAGAEVVGPAPTLERALQLIDGGPVLDGAILDVNLRGDMVYPIADRLRQEGVPFVFATGYDENILPQRFRHVVRCSKPVNLHQLSRAMAQLIRA
jgi:CheY-like chemotaxis protein